MLVLDNVEIPDPGPGEVRVRVRAAGLNPVDAKIFRGAPTSRPFALDLPSGNGTDWCGVVEALGRNVVGVRPGDEVLGGKMFGAQADYVIVAVGDLVSRPIGLGVFEAGALSTVGRTAWASVESLDLGPDDVVLVSAAAGGVGVLAAQLARRRGARVIGSARPSNHDFLRTLDVEPVDHRGDLVAAVRRLSPAGITAGLDNHGRASVEAALALGAPPARVNSIADYAAASDYGTTAVGGFDAPADALAIVAMLIAKGNLAFPIAAVFPLEKVADAYRMLLRGRTRGKIVLNVESQASEA